MSIRFSRLCALLSVLPLLYTGSAAWAADPNGAPQYPQQVIMGWVEHVYIPDIDSRLKAKLDTGATTSSMRAEVVKVIKAEEVEESDDNTETAVVVHADEPAEAVAQTDEEPVKTEKKKAKKPASQESVIFQIEDEDGKITTLQRKLVRWVRIKSRTGGEAFRRPVVEMEFCVGGRRVTSEVNLAPRSDFIYPILVGRNMLRDAAILVDANKTYTYQSRCPVKMADE